MSVIPFHRAIRYGSSAPLDIAILSQRVGVVAEISQRFRDLGRSVKKEPDLIDIEVAPGLALWQLLYEDRGILSRDLRRLFQGTIDRAVTADPATITPPDEVAALGLWPANPSQNPVDTDADWISLLRVHLKRHSRSAAELLSGFREAFPILAFSDNFPDCLDTFDGPLADFRPVVLESLSKLNDAMPGCMEAASTKETLEAFSAKSGFETTMEGDASRKSALTFNFSMAAGKKLVVVCQPHMKLRHSARTGDSTYYFHRIYFSSSDHEGLRGKILVGHAGKHL